MSNTFFTKLVCLLMVCLSVGVHARDCPESAKRGKEASDKFDGKRAACVAKEIKKIEAWFSTTTIQQSTDALELVKAAICGQTIDDQKLVTERLRNPVKTTCNGGCDKYVSYDKQTATSMMLKGCAFSPKLKAHSRTQFTFYFQPYLTDSYAGASYRYKLYGERWYLISQHWDVD